MVLRFFLFGFENNDRATIGAHELATPQKIAVAFLTLDTTAPERSVTEGGCSACLFPRYSQNLCQNFS
jgi:hypothetical protein